MKVRQVISMAASVSAVAAATVLVFAGPAGAGALTAEPTDPDRITVEGSWRSLTPGQTQTVDEVRCPDTHPFVFNEMYGARPWRLTPGVEVRVGDGRAGDLAVDIRGVIPRSEDKTAIGIGPAELNRVTALSGAAVSYRVDVHCTSDENDSYS